jgi:RNA polymerase sigma factor (sigma-70 family)
MDHAAVGMRRLRDVWPDDQELTQPVRAAQQGTPGALDALLARLRPSFVACFAPRLGADEAEDTAQNALLRVTRALPHIDPERAGRYLTRLAWNLLRQEYRRSTHEAWRFAPVELAADIEAPGTPDGDMEYCDLIRVVHEFSLASLSPKLRDSVLGLLRDLRPSEMAAQQGASGSTIRARVRLARAHLRRKLGRSAPDIRGQRGKGSDTSRRDT